MLVNLDAGGDEEHALFLSLRSVCPDAYIVLLADDAVDECNIIRALEIGARGYLRITAVESHLSKALQVVGQGEAWISRKMMGSILDRVLN
jgi:DNA-binding NarL/FixJ family response regulator